MSPAKTWLDRASYCSFSASSASQAHLISSARCKNRRLAFSDRITRGALRQITRDGILVSPSRSISFNAISEKEKEILCVIFAFFTTGLDCCFDLLVLDLVVDDLVPIPELVDDELVYNAGGDKWII